MKAIAPALALLLLLQDEPRFRMPDYGGKEPPPARTRAEIEKILAGAPSPPEPVRPIRVALVAGKKDHGAGEHDYPAWGKAWSELLKQAPEVQVTLSDPWPDAETIAAADVVVVYQRGTWNAAQAEAVDALLARGGGLMLLHWAVGAGKDCEEKAKRVGLCWKDKQSKYRHGALELTFAPHAITRNVEKAGFVDESYWRLGGDPAGVQVLATGPEEGQPWPLLWTKEAGKGRVAVSILGHYMWTFDDPLFRTLALRMIAWAAREPVDRFNALVMRGARLAD